MIQENSDVKAPKDLKQVRNIKYTSQKQITGFHDNFADHVQHVENLVHTSEFV